MSTNIVQPDSASSIYDCVGGQRPIPSTEFPVSANSGQRSVAGISVSSAISLASNINRNNFYADNLTSSNNIPSNFNHISSTISINNQPDNFPAIKNNCINNGINFDSHQLELPSYNNSYYNNQKHYASTSIITENANRTTFTNNFGTQLQNNKIILNDNPMPDLSPLPSRHSYVAH